MRILKYLNNKYIVEGSASLLIQQLQEGKNLIRFGDGEFYVMEGLNIYFQPYHADLSLRLKEIVRADSPNLVISANIGRARHLAFMHPDKIYYSNISRVYDYALVGKIIGLFAGKNVVAVHHCEDWRIKKMFNKAKSYKFILVKSTDCFQKYDETLAKCKLEPIGTFFYLSCGPMAKILAWDLHNAGYRVIDLGRFHDKLKKKLYRSYMK